MSDALQLGREPDPPELNHEDTVFVSVALYGGGLPVTGRTSDVLPLEPCDQEDPSCVAEAASQIIWAAQVAAGAVPDQRELMARKVVYGGYRRMQNNFGRRVGGHIRNCFTWMAKHGVCRERHHHYSLPFNLVGYSSGWGLRPLSLALKGGLIRGAGRYEQSGAVLPAVHRYVG